MFEFQFEWNPAKAAGNRREHRIGFDLAATVFHDPLAASIPDEEHGETEERWITLGEADDGRLLVVIHTYQEIDPTTAKVRIISARCATRHERRQYEAGT